MDSNLKKEAVILFIFSGLSKILAFYREILLAAFFGTSLILDAYYAGTAFSNFLLFFFSGGAFIPLLISFYSKSQRKKSLNLFFLMLFLLSFLLSCLTVLWGENILQGVSKDIRSQALVVLRLTSFSTIFYVVSSIMRAMLNSFGSYRWSGLQDFIMIVVVIVGIYLAKNNDALYILSVTFLVSSIFRVLVQLPAFVKNIGKIPLSVNWDFKSIIFYSKKFFPLMLVIMIPQLFIVYTRNVASGIDVGSLAGLAFAERTSDVAKSILAFSLGAVIVNPMSKMADNKNRGSFVGILNKALKYVFFLSIPLGLLFFFASEQIVEILYLRGNFGVNSLRIVSDSLKYYSLASLLSSPVYIVATALYTLGDWKTFLISATIGTISAYLFVWKLSVSLGVISITLGIGIYLFLFFLISYSFLSKGIDVKKFYLNTVKQFLISLISFIAAGLMYYVLGVLVSLIILLLLFVFLSYLFKEEVFVEIVGILQTKVFKRVNRF